MCRCQNFGTSFRKESINETVQELFTEIIESQNTMPKAPKWREKKPNFELQCSKL